MNNEDLIIRGIDIITDFPENIKPYYTGVYNDPYGTHNRHLKLKNGLTYSLLKDEMIYWKYNGYTEIAVVGSESKLLPLNPSGYKVELVKDEQVLEIKKYLETLDYEVEEIDLSRWVKND